MIWRFDRKVGEYAISAACKEPFLPIGRVGFGIPSSRPNSAKIYSRTFTGRIRARRERCRVVQGRDFFNCPRSIHGERSHCEPGGQKVVLRAAGADFWERTNSRNLCRPHASHAGIEKLRTSYRGIRSLRESLSLLGAIDEKSLWVGAIGAHGDTNFELVPSSRTPGRPGCYETRNFRSEGAVQSPASDGPILAAGTVPGSSQAEGSQPCCSQGSRPGVGNCGGGNRQDCRVACCSCLAENTPGTSMQGGDHGR